MRKYKIRKDLKTIQGLYRIQACKNFRDVKVGDFGGHVESYRNLSQDGNCWVYPSCIVRGNARVDGDSEVTCDSEISGDTIIKGPVTIIASNISGKSIVFPHTFIARSNVCDSWIFEHVILNSCTVKKGSIISRNSILVDRKLPIFSTDEKVQDRQK